MDDQTISAIAAELAPALVEHSLGKVFQLARAAMAMDFRTQDTRYLFVSIAPDGPRLYLMKRSVRELEQQSLAASPFALTLRRLLGGARLQALTKDANDRIVRFAFAGCEESGEPYRRSLVAQLTGRTANLFVLDERGRILDALRSPAHSAPQQIGDIYQPPTQSSPPFSDSPAKQAPATDMPATDMPATGVPVTGELGQPPQSAFSTSSSTYLATSEAADAYYRRIEEERLFRTRAATLAARIRKEIEKRRKLERNLENDLTTHGDANQHKRIGELLLANISTAERHGKAVMIKDYYAEGEPTLELAIDENTTLPEEATKRFARYTKAKRALQEISDRLEKLHVELGALEQQRTTLEAIIDDQDTEQLDLFEKEITGNKVRPTAAPASRGGKGGAKGQSKQSAENVPGARRFRSSDGYEIFVGRSAQDNDHLTFRVARPHDWWFHAADYPGSHVIVRNHARGSAGNDVPHRTLVEAAQLAATYSNARHDAKVDVHYTQRKFLSKPKGGAPGLVRMSTFRTLLVEPRADSQRILPEQGKA